MAVIRTFISFDTPPEFKEMLQEAVDELRPCGADIRWEPKEKFHATIKFLGNTDEAGLPAINSIIQQTACAFAPIALTFDRFGCFPGMRNPRVLWAGCSEHDPAISRMKDRLDAALSPFGFDVEHRTFHPHITLGRFKTDRGSKDLISKLETITFGRFTLTVKELLLMKSVLSREGSHYSILQTFSLTNGL